MLLLKTLPVLMLLTLTVQDSGRIKKDIPGFNKPVLAFVPAAARSGRTVGMILVIHGTSGSGPYMSKYFDAEKLGAAGYMVVLPTSHNGGWGITRGGAEGREKDVALIKGVLDTFTKDYNVHPDKIHVVGYSAGSVLACQVIGQRSDWDDYRFRSICAHSGGFNGGGTAKADRAKETAIWVVNGDRDTAHAKPPKNMYESFKKAGYDAKYEVVPGKGHGYPIISFERMFAWWKELDANAPNYEKIKAALKKGNDQLKRKKYSQAYRAFQDVVKATTSKAYVEPARKGLAAIEAEANRQFEEAGSLAESNPARAKKILKAIAKKFSKTPYADKAKAAVKKIR